MLRESYYLLRYGPKVHSRQKEMGLVDFQKDLAKRVDVDGYAELRSRLVGDLEGNILDTPGSGLVFNSFLWSQRRDRRNGDKSNYWNA